MGSINVDRIPIEHWRGRAETVAEMQAAGWSVMTKCSTCSLMMRTDLRLVARISGPGTSLWNRKGRCRRIGCPGFVDFWGHPRELNHDLLLRAPWPAHKPPLSAPRR